MLAPATSLDIWLPGERSVWDPPEDLTVTEWAEKYRWISRKTGRLAGRFRVDPLFSYCREVMDSLSDPRVRQVTLQWATQMGKTTVIENWLGWQVDQSPAPAMLVFPTETLLKRFVERSLDPTFEESPKLRAHLTGRDADMTNEKARLDTMTIWLSWANSAAMLAMISAMRVACDEVGKYPSQVGQEADSIALARKRLEEYEDVGVMLVTSTPTIAGDLIDREFRDSDERRYWVPCPHCGEFQTLEWVQVKFPEDATRQEIAREDLAHYECARCDEHITDLEKRDALPLGVWCPRGGTVDRDGQVQGVRLDSEHRGYQLSKLYRHNARWSRLAARFLKARETDSGRRDWKNSELGEHYVDELAVADRETLRQLEGGYRPGTVPERAQVLYAGVDVHKGTRKKRFVFTLWAFGPPPAGQTDAEAWLVLEGGLDTWEQLADLLFASSYQHEGHARPMPVRFSFVDANWDTEEVQAWCRRHMEKTRPVRGNEYLAGAPLRYVSLNTTKKKAKRAVRRRAKLVGERVDVDVNYFKTKVHRSCYIHDGGTVATHFPDGVSDAYLDGLCSEMQVRDPKNNRAVWVQAAGGGPNDFLDATVYAWAAAEMEEVWKLKPRAVAPRRRRAAPEGGGDDDWLGLGGDWL